MELLAEWLPKAASCLIVLIGLVGFFKPKILLEPMQFSMGGNQAISESRAVFGGINLGAGVTALYLTDPAIYTLLGMAWLGATIARPYSMIVDGSSLKESIPLICTDLIIAWLFLSHLFLA
jgi:hypothetical protein